VTDENTKHEEQPTPNDQAAKIEALPEQPISESDAQSVKGGGVIPKLAI
jgi:hypothetical protein